MLSSTSVCSKLSVRRVLEETIYKISCEIEKTQKEVSLASLPPHRHRLNEPYTQQSGTQQPSVFTL